MHYLLSVPPAAIASIAKFENLESPEWYINSDPVGKRLGSGGGSVHLLLSAWRDMAAGQDFQSWLSSSRKLMIHGGGQGRRLPAYAPVGKLFIPMPIWRWSRGQRIDQKLLDLQRSYLERIFANAPASTRLMIASGDVLVKFANRLPVFPDADVICIGLWGKPEAARNFGVFFCNRQNPNELEFFRQKPSLPEIQELARDKIFLLDAGIWLLSDRAVAALLSLGNCDTGNPYMNDNPSASFELYSDFGLGLGNNPVKINRQINSLSVAVIPLDDGEFYHFGRSSDLIESSLRLQNLVLNQSKQNFIGFKRHPDLFVQNACIETEWTAKNHRIWVENSHIGKGWRLTSDHILTGIPRNDWALRLPPGTCLDIVPIDGTDKRAVRFYKMQDEFRGALNKKTTQWMGESAYKWFKNRNINLEQAGFSPATDIQQSSVFPVIEKQKIDRDFLQWLIRAKPKLNDNEKFAATYCQSERVSAQDICDRARLDTLYQQRLGFLSENLHDLSSNYKNSVFHRADLTRMAELYAANNIEAPPLVPEDESDVMTIVHDRMFHAQTLRQRNNKDWQKYEEQAFALLRKAILEPVMEKMAFPQCSVAPDQIVWARCPVRLDLAGGWTDTPPYCQIYGGKVLNLAVNLNGQPPLQSFIRRCDNPHIVLRSIDLGSEITLKSYNHINNFAQVENEFSIAKAALAIAGFHPDFNGGSFKSLEEQLKDFGGGLEISFIAAVPKGSGLGTSSILGATILGALADFCTLEWDRHEICNRTLALEQMLTSGGGWQDQFGAVLHGIKLLETNPGLTQSPRVKWLPERMFTEAFRDGRILLYYTGVTRLAKNILQEIVRGMFLNEQSRLKLLEELGRHAQETYEIMHSADWPSLCQAINRSWILNQRLDSGTNNPGIQQIIDRIERWNAGVKLLGAGGGGYLMICTPDTDAARQIQTDLTTMPPNSKARFVVPELSTHGLQVTRS